MSVSDEQPRIGRGRRRAVIWALIAAVVVGLVVTPVVYDRTYCDPPRVSAPKLEIPGGLVDPYRDPVIDLHGDPVSERYGGEVSGVTERPGGMDFTLVDAAGETLSFDVWTGDPAADLQTVGAAYGRSVRIDIAVGEELWVDYSYQNSTFGGTHTALTIWDDDGLVLAAGTAHPFWPDIPWPISVSGGHGRTMCRGILVPSSLQFASDSDSARLWAGDVTVLDAGQSRYLVATIHASTRGQTDISDVGGSTRYFMARVLEGEPD